MGNDTTTTEKKRMSIFKKLKKSVSKKKKNKDAPHDDPLEDDDGDDVVKKESDDTAPQTSESTSSDIIEEEEENDDEPPANVVEPYDGTMSSRGVPVISSTTGNILPSAVAGDSQGGYKDSRSGTVPSARDSAFGGPPRYDWIDVESSAAIKIQSNYRRHSTITQLERQGDLTSSMRNNIRARQSLKTNMVTEDVPSVFRLCGIGFLFGDALGGDSQVL